MHTFEYDSLPIIETKQGKLQGYQYDGIYTYKGIPYAKAERWQLAKPYSWQGVFDATSYGRVAPLMEQDNPKGELMVPHMYWPQDEDCLSLNIWTKDLTKKKPVMVWIHGGGYFAGSSIEQLAYDGANLANDDVVVVSLNHRLNILGFLDLEPFGEQFKDSANAGLDDIVCALQWIQENIAQFGGDPNNVTLFGQSGGGMKIGLLMQIPKAAGLFHKGIMMSGIGGEFMPPYSGGTGKEIVTAMLEYLHFEKIEELVEAPYPQVFEAYSHCSKAIASKGGYIGNNPRIDAYCLGEGQEVGFTDFAKTVPVMIGSVFGEFGSFNPLPIDKYHTSQEEQYKLVEQRYHDHTSQIVEEFKQAYPEKQIADLLVLDTVFRPINKKFIDVKANDPQAPVYTYVFGLDFPIHHGQAAWHCSDIPFFFNNIDKAPYANIEGVSETLQQQMSQAFIHFAKDGNPNHEGLPTWNPCTKGHEETMIFDKECSVRVNFDTKLLKDMMDAIPPITLAQLHGEIDVQH